MGKWSTTHNIPSFRKTTTPFNAIELQMEGWTGGRDKVDCTKDWGREWHYWHYTYSAGRTAELSKVNSPRWCSSSWYAARMMLGGQPQPWGCCRMTISTPRMDNPSKNQLASHTPWLREKHLTSSKPNSTFESTCAWQSAVAEELSLVVGERFEEEGPSFRQQKAVW